MTETLTLNEQMLARGRRARAAAAGLRDAPAVARTRALDGLARRLIAAEADILAANARDVAAGRANGMSEALIDRLALTPARIAGMAQAVATIAAVPDPLGVETERWTPANGLDIARVRTPIGVLGVIYESRPNVTADAAALCIRSGNAAILRCGSDCLQSSLAIAGLIAESLAEAGLPADLATKLARETVAGSGELLRRSEQDSATLRQNVTSKLRALSRWRVTTPAIDHISVIATISKTARLWVSFIAELQPEF
jgi:glutamate-5-semialdehyde dehydrogenase